jgi:hypothetical protein
MQQPPVGPQPSTHVPETPPGWVPPVNTQPTNALAVVSLVAGIASFVFAPFIGAVIAVITGHMAKAEIRRTGEGGEAFATVGLILGYIHLVLFILVVVFIGLLLLGGLGFFFAAQQH